MPDSRKPNRSSKRGPRKPAQSYDSRSRDRGGAPSGGNPSRRIIATGSELPKWLREEIIRTTKKERREAVLNLLNSAAEEFAEARYPAARAKLLKAKELSSRAAAIRELLGLSAYRMGIWDEALRELRAFRRIGGDTTHMAVEMDALRALGRPRDVHKSWETFMELGGSKAADCEVRVVYGSFLLDEGSAREAWEIVKPGRIPPEAPEWELRRWYVAARVAASLGDADTARQLVRAINANDSGFPGMTELQEEISQ